MSSPKNDLAAAGPLPPAENITQQAVIELPEDVLQPAEIKDRESCLARRLVASIRKTGGICMTGGLARCVQFIGRVDTTWTCYEIRDVGLDRKCLKKMKHTFWLSRIVRGHSRAERGASSLNPRTNKQTQQMKSILKNNQEDSVLTIFRCFSGCSHLSTSSHSSQPSTRQAFKPLRSNCLSKLAYRKVPRAHASMHACMHAYM